MKTPKEQLNEAAEKYALSEWGILESLGTNRIYSKQDFVAGALSPEAANRCNKHVEKAKIEFAIEQLNKIYPNEFLLDRNTLINELEQQLNQLEQ